MARRKRALALLILAALLTAACVGRGGSTSPSRSPGSPVSSAPPPTVRLIGVAVVRKPLDLATRTGDPTLYVVSKTGEVWALRSGRVDPTPVLDLSTEVTHGDEQGLLGLAFSPDGRFAYLNYTDLRGNTNVVEYAWRNGGPDLSSRRLVLFVRQPFVNHNGGDLVFGPDGDLYVGLGDGGSDANSPSPGDPFKNGQNLRVLLGKMLRIDPRLQDGSLPPNGAGYAVPADNPFIHRSRVRPEIWAYGLRNPWRYSFDRRTRDLWIADVGAGAREEVDVQPAGSAGGQNYGWSVLEGTAADGLPPPNAIPPVLEYDHTGGGCAVTGGYVYRGTTLPGLDGWYVFGDYCLGAIQALRLTAGSRRLYVISADPVPQLASFGQDQQGELYALSLAGGVYKLAR